jgi:hypothetical protein
MVPHPSICDLDSHPIHRVQRAAMGADLMPMLQEEAKQRQRAAGHYADPPKVHKATLPEALKGQARDIAGGG